MMNHFSVTGIGMCVHQILDHEDLIEAITTQKKPAKPRIEPTARHAVHAALKYQDEKPVLMISNREVSRKLLEEFAISEHRIMDSFSGMLEGAVQLFEGAEAPNVLLLAAGEDGYAAVLLSKEPQRCMAQVSIDVRGVSADGALLEDMMQFITAVVEIRFAFKLDGSTQNGTYIWHWMEKRALTRFIDGVTVCMKEAEQVNRAVFASRRYLLPVGFQTAEEAREKLTSLQRDAARDGLYATMQRCITALREGAPAEHTIVLLADSLDSLKAQTEDLLARSDKLLSEGFRWTGADGSLYIRRTTPNPKVVFMNPPGGMFNSKPFRRFVSKLYDFVEGPVRSAKGVYDNGSQNETLHRYLDEVNITFVVMYLLEAIGIHPDYLSGASMGEVVFDLSNTAIRGAARSEELDAAMNSLEATMRRVLEGRKAHEEAYFGREVDLTKYYLKCDAEAVKQAVAEYEDVFVIIEGSPKDVLICGERASCEALVRKLGCVAMELDDPMYVHTPVVECEYEKIRRDIMEAGVYMDVDALPYRLFSTYLRKDMDSSTEMFAENFASIITRSVNYTEAVRTLYEQDARVFIDLSTTQLCGNWAKNTLAQQADAEIISIYEEKPIADYLMDLCASLLAGHVAFDFEKMLAKLTFANDAPVMEAPVEKAPVKPAVSAPEAPKPAVQMPPQEEVKTMENARITPNQPAVAEPVDLREQLQQYIANQMAVNQKAYEMYLEAENRLFGQIMAAQSGKNPPRVPEAAVPKAEAPKKNYLWDREQVIEMTDRSMAAVLGEQYREVDQYPIRARMPLPPFLFVSRIVSIDAEFGKLRPSSIVSEYDLDESCVFRTGDTQISPLIGSEASHIAIFLIAYMGLDAMSKGTLSYRAIDSSQVSYSERPFRVGDTMRTVLKINRFIQNGTTILLFFTFETYNGDELISVTEATGGFFTKEELASNKGIIAPKKLLQKAEPREFLHFSSTDKTSYSEEEVSAFYNGQYEACFGARQKKPSLKETYYVNDMKMIDRVTKIDYNGGMYGKGMICGEKQITPDMWPFKAHFKNDPVFPAIIMTDGVTQLGVFLFAHAGLLSKFDSTNVTMINGNRVVSKFRGQARHGYSTLRYEVHVKDVVQTDDCISVYFDAGIFNDGLQIIQVESYALKIFSDPN